MAAPSKNFTNITDAQIDADSPIDTTLMTELRDNDVNLKEWLGKDYTPAVSHDHDGINSKGLGGNPCMGTWFLGIKNMPQNSTKYFMVLGGAGISGASESLAQYIPHSPVTIKDLFIFANAAPPAGQTYTVTLRKNGVDTLLTASIDNTHTLVSNLANAVDFGTQDKISWKCVSSAATGSTIDLVISFRHIQWGTNNGESLVPFNVTEPVGIHGIGTTSTGGITERIPIARATTFNNRITFGAGSVGYGININSIGFTSQAGMLLNAQDCFIFSNTGGVAAVMGSWGLGRLKDLNSDTIGILLFESNNQLQATTRYMTGIGYQSAASTDETEVQVPVKAGTLKNLALKNNGSGVAGQTWTATVRKNGVDTALVVTLSGTDTIGSDITDTVTVADGDLISIKIVSSATTGSRDMSASMEHTA